MPSAGIFTRIATGLGRRAGRKYVGVGTSIKRHFGTKTWGPEYGYLYPQSRVTVTSALDTIEADMKRFLRENISPVIRAPVIGAGKGMGKGIGRGIFTLGKTTARSMGRHPFAWGAAVAVGGTMYGAGRGIQQGLSQQGYPVDTADTLPVFSFGPGYQTWAHGRGRPLSPNHLGTAGLPQALHKTRHR